MSRREECSINCYEDAKNWLEHYKHTITDRQVLEVINQIEHITSEEWDDLQNQVSCKEDQIASLDEKLKELRIKNKELEQEILEVKAEHLSKEEAK